MGDHLGGARYPPPRSPHKALDEIVARSRSTAGRDVGQIPDVVMEFWATTLRHGGPSELTLFPNGKAVIRRELRPRLRLLKLASVGALGLVGFALAADQVIHDHELEDEIPQHAVVDSALIVLARFAGPELSSDRLSSNELGDLRGGSMDSAPPPVPLSNVAFDDFGECQLPR